jgi:hypothetical protein
MTTLTVNIPNDKNLAAVQEALDRFELSYIVDTNTDYTFSEAEIKSFLKTKPVFIEWQNNCP